MTLHHKVKNTTRGCPGKLSEKRKHGKSDRKRDQRKKNPNKNGGGRGNKENRIWVRRGLNPQSR